MLLYLLRTVLQKQSVVLVAAADDVAVGYLHRDF